MTTATAGRTRLRPQILPDDEMRRVKRYSLNRLPDTRDWRVTDPLCKYLKALNEGPYIHRKAWEYGMCVMGLYQLGAVNPFAHGLAVAAGYERPFYYFANHIERMVATDLYECPGLEGDPAVVVDPRKFAPIPYREDRLEVLRMDALDLRFPENSFDFVFCLSSIEHYGSRENSRRGMAEMHRVVKPGGIVCVATELILNDTQHHEYFTPEEFEEVILNSTPLELVGGPLDLRISESLVKYPIVLEIDDPYISPQIVLQSGNVIWTSLMCFFRKPH